MPLPESLFRPLPAAAELTEASMVRPEPPADSADDEAARQAAADSLADQRLIERTVARRDRTALIIVICLALIMAVVVVGAIMIIRG